VSAVRIAADPHALAVEAEAHVAAAIRDAVSARGVAHVMFASGNSQLELLERLTTDERVPWDGVVGLHMDEYLGIGVDHPASFARYMHERIVERANPREFHFIDGRAEPEAECRRYARLLHELPLDLCVLGIGENGHLAFNDPPVADFDDPLAVKVVELDAVCRQQQVGEGHFPGFGAVPTHAITVTVPALLRARTVVAVVPEARKAVPVARALDGPVSTDCPASKLQDCEHATVYLEPASAAGLRSSRA
jgi:glucosamine-6-phosphate deaminase